MDPLDAKAVHQRAGVHTGFIARRRVPRGLRDLGGFTTVGTARCSVQCRAHHEGEGDERDLGVGHAPLH